MCAARGQQPSGAAAAVGAGISVAFEQPLPSCKRVCEGKESGKQRALSVCVLRYLHAGSERGAPTSHADGKTCE